MFIISTDVYLVLDFYNIHKIKCYYIFYRDLRLLYTQYTQYKQYMNNKLYKLLLVLWLSIAESSTAF